MQVKKQQLEPEMEQWTGSKLGKEHVKVVYCQPAYLISMLSTSCKMPDELWNEVRDIVQETGIKTIPMEQWTGSKLGKEYVKAVYCHPV